MGLGRSEWLRVEESCTLERSANSVIAFFRLDEPKGACAFRLEVVVARLTEASFFSSFFLSLLPKLFQTRCLMEACVR